jgi:hypothetical protein
MKQKSHRRPVDLRINIAEIPVDAVVVQALALVMRTRNDISVYSENDA